MDDQLKEFAASAVDDVLSRQQLLRERCDRRSTRRRTPAQVGGRNIDCNERRDCFRDDFDCNELRENDERMCGRSCAARQRQTEATGIRRRILRKLVAIGVNVRRERHQPHAQRQAEHDDTRALS